MTGVPALEADASAVTVPIIVPGSMMGSRSREGRSSPSRSPVAQFRVRESTIAVVVAFVYSDCSRPDSQKLSRSGMVAIACAAATSLGVERHAAYNW